MNLGLDAVRGIVQRHDGDFMVHAAPEAGLRFDLLFPAALARALSGPTTAARMGLAGAVAEWLKAPVC